MEEGVLNPAVKPEHQTRLQTNSRSASTYVRLRLDVRPASLDHKNPSPEMAEILVEVAVNSELVEKAEKRLRETAIHQESFANAVREREIPEN